MVCAAALLALSGSALAQPSSCKAPTTLAAFDAPLSGLARAIEERRKIRIVAIGSSSTEGTGASSKLAAYPARFDHELDRLFPDRDIDVINLGKGGELADAMLLRIRNDVLPQRPTLVLWQTGVNDAIHGVDIVTFRNTLETGLGLMKSAGVEVVLVDPQYYPRSSTVARYRDFVTIMHDVAKVYKVPVFRRYAIMQHLISSGQHKVEALLWKDQFHLNDASYSCLAQLMASAVAECIRRREPGALPGALIVRQGSGTVGPTSATPWDVESRAF